MKKRTIYQILATIGFNSYLPAWLKGTIFQGKIKGICVPVLNCYSCPSALGACPIGSLQSQLSTLRFNLSTGVRQFGLYIVGLLGLVGSLVGRIPCGWLCPFGLLQDVLHKIPGPKFSIPRFMGYFRYAFLLVMVVLLPLLVLDEFGLGQTWFCKWVCPAGTFEAGIPLVLLNANIRSQIGFLFTYKMIVLGIFLVWMVFASRPFCRTTCPLGAILGLFNKVSLYRMTVEDDKCLRCDACKKVCPVEIKIYEHPDSPDCIRCLECKKACAFGAIHSGFSGKALNRERVAAEIRPGS